MQVGADTVCQKTGTMREVALVPEGQLIISRLDNARGAQLLMARCFNQIGIITIFLYIP